MTVTPSPDQRAAAQRVAVLRAVQKIHGFRPYLDKEELERLIMALPRGRNWDARRWAEHCAYLVEHGQPLPWDQGPASNPFREVEWFNQGVFAYERGDPVESRPDDPSNARRAICWEQGWLTGQAKAMGWPVDERSPADPTRFE